MTEPIVLRVLHAVRILGFAGTPAVARRFALDGDRTAEVLADAEARGWVSYTGFADLHGWSLTESGRAENERLLAEELDRTGARAEVAAVHREFLPLNARLLRACTDWQLRIVGDRLVSSDHRDAAWDGAVLDELTAIGRDLSPLSDRLGQALHRMRGYDSRFERALVRARAGEGAWVDGTDIDSCHRVWFELHEDLVATLQVTRGAAS